MPRQNKAISQVNPTTEPENDVVGLPEKAVKAIGKTVNVTLPGPEGSATMQRIGGSGRDTFNSVVLQTVMTTAHCRGLDEAGLEKMLITASTAMAAFKPADEIEGMLAAQAVACHFGAMEAFRRSMVAEQPSDVASRLRKDGANLARAMTDMIEALDRKRGKGPQVVRVERVVVQEGGQAVVGNVTTGKAGGRAGA
jgi:hypothetical protein